MVAIAVITVSLLAASGQINFAQAKSQSSTTTITTTTNSTTTITNSTTGTVSKNGTIRLPRENFGYVPLQINDTSYLIYATESDVAISTAVMNSLQFLQFSQGQNNISDSAYNQNGTSNLNALLLTNGTYYLTFFAFQDTANFTYFYNIISNITVQNATTYVGAYLTIPPFSELAHLVHLQTLGSPNVMALFGVSNQSITYTVYDNTTHSSVLNSARPETVTNMSFTSNSHRLARIQRHPFPGCVHAVPEKQPVHASLCLC